MLSRRHIVLATLGALASELPGQAPSYSRPKKSEAKAPAMPSANLRVDTSLVLVPVTVNDEFNRPVTGLEKENFRIFEDKVDQPITAFSTEDEPIALGFVFDTSYSMRHAMPQGRQAAAQFLKLADDGDEFFLVEFDSHPRLVIPLTAETGRINTEIMLTKPVGSTALIDGLYLAIHEIGKSKKAKKALVLISDGGENNSRYTAADVKRVVRESDVLIYTVAMSAGYDPEEAYGLGLMNQIAEMSGAHTFQASGVDLAEIASRIAIDLRNRYVLAYTPHDARRDGKYHRIEVKLAPPKGLPKLRAHWRTGYYAPID